MKKITFLLLIIFVFTACNKYEDGPVISLRTVEKRLIGKWKITELTYNELQITNAYYASHLDLFPMEIYSDWSDDLFIAFTHTDGNIIAKSVLNLDKKKQHVSFMLVADDYYIPIANDLFSVVPPLQVETTWQILRLKNNELWICTDSESNRFEMHFELLADFSDY